MFHIGLYRGTMKKILHNAHILDIWYVAIPRGLVGQMSSNYALWAKMSPPQGLHRFTLINFSEYAHVAYQIRGN